MSGWIAFSFAAAAVALLALASALRAAMNRGVHRWLWPYLRQAPRRRRRRVGDATHLLLCVCDHFEPEWGGARREEADARVERWVRRYSQCLGTFRDSDGRPPRHTFFYPIDEYDPDRVDSLAELCRAGYGEVEVHLHHDAQRDGETSASHRKRFADHAQMMADRHRLLARWPDGRVAYGFIHGNWALDNSRPDGRWCGINDELDILRETGCYADFTFPSAPSPTQPKKINSIYYALDDPGRPRSHDEGVDVGAAPCPASALMLIQGPLLLDWSRRKWGVLPRLENGNIQHTQPPNPARIPLWLKAGVRVARRPDWVFVKLHTHGAQPAIERSLLGEPARRLHRALAHLARDDPTFHFHYVTAREMYNLARAAEAGWSGTVADARDFELSWNGAAAPTAVAEMNG